MVKAEQRKRAERFGRSAESWAILYLRLKGYRILGARLKMRGGEIDVVARRGGTIIFVEVKARQTVAGLDQAYEAVNQKRIIQAANHWLSQNPQYADTTIRFDVIGLAPLAWPMHIVDAFQIN